MYLYVNFEIIKVYLETLWNRVDIVDREIELEVSFKRSFCKKD